MHFLNERLLQIVIEILKEHGYRYYRNGKGSHEIWIKQDAHGKLTGRVQIPTHLADKHFLKTLTRYWHYRQS